MAWSTNFEIHGANGQKLGIRLFSDQIWSWVSRQTTVKIPGQFGSWSAGEGASRLFLSSGDDIFSKKTPFIDLYSTELSSSFWGTRFNSYVLTSTTGGFQKGWYNTVVEDLEHGGVVGLIVDQVEASLKAKDEAGRRAIQGGSRP